MKNFFDYHYDDSQEKIDWSLVFKKLVKKEKSRKKNRKERRHEK